MKTFPFTNAFVIGCTLVMSANRALAQDWPQWRGVNRDGKVASFAAPKTWPSELKQRWKVTTGQADATPALVGDRLYTFTRQEGKEVTRCLEAATGKELWKDDYDALGFSGGDQGHQGPRSSPAIANGKVVTLGVQGMVSCLDAASGKVLWRKDEFQARPQFHTGFSPLIVDGWAILHLGGQANGAMVAYDLNTGQQKWKWTGEEPGQGSAVLANIAGNKCIVALTGQSLVGLNAANGNLLFKTAVAGRQKITTPIVDGQTVIVFFEGGAKAFKVEKDSDQFAAKELWTTSENVVRFSTPILKNGFLYGLSQSGTYFCMNAKDGKTVWTSAPPAADAGASGGGQGGRGGRGGPGGFGSVVDAGLVLLALTPAMQLVAIEPTDKAYTELAKIKVAETQTYAHPVISGKRVFIQDQNSLTLWTLD